MPVWKYHIVNRKWWRISVYCMRTVLLTLLWFVQGDKDGYLFIYIVTIFLLLVGNKILIWNVMHFWECLYFCCIGLHLCKRCSIMNSVNRWAVIMESIFVFVISFEEKYLPVCPMYALLQSGPVNL
jgi:hypothetical protein